MTEIYDAQSSENQLPEITEIDVNPQPIPEDVHLTFEPQPEFIKIDADKIETLQDVKLLFKALDLGCSKDFMDKFNLWHLAAETESVDNGLQDT